MAEGDATYLLTVCTGEDGLVHTLRVSAHGISVCCCVLVILTRASTRGACVDVVHVAAMCMCVAIVPIFKVFHL